MKQQDKPTYKGLIFDSVGEMHFYWWCEELMQAGFIDNVSPQPSVFELSGSVSLLYLKPMKKVEDKYLEKVILNSHSYTADFMIKFNDSAEKKFFINPIDNSPLKKEHTSLLIGNGMNCHIEVKPIFDQNNMTRLAVLNQKWVMEKFGIFINIVIPEKLFQKTFTPKRYLTCDKSSAKRKIKYTNIISLDEFLLSS